MVIRVSIKDLGLDYDDEGNPLGNSLRIIKPRDEPLKIPHVWRLMELWLPPKEEGGYEKFIEDYGLEGTVTKEQLEILFTQTNARMGKRLAGILSILVPPELCSWQQMKNMYERDAVKQESSGKEPVTVEISDEAANSYIASLVRRLMTVEQPTFQTLLRLYRRANLLTTDELGDKTGIGSHIRDWQLYDRVHDDHNYLTHKLCDVFGITDPYIRTVMLDAGSLGGLEELESDNPETRRKGRMAMMGGGTVFGAMLNKLRNDKEWSLEKLAEKMGVGHSTVHRWATSQDIQHLPRLHTIHKLCDVLEAPAKTRVAMINAASQGELNKLESDDSEIRHKGFVALTGGHNIFGALLYHLRNDLGLSRPQLAKRMGISEKTITTWERGGIPNQHMVHAICDALEVEPKTRMVMLNAASQGGLDKLESDDPEMQREGFAAVLGGKSLFGALVFHLRNDHSLSQQQLADRMGVTITTIQNWEAGKSIPREQMMHPLCDALGLEPECQTRETLLKVAEIAREIRNHPRRQ